LRRHKIRQGKKIQSMSEPPSPAEEPFSLPRPMYTPELLAYRFSIPGPSGEFDDQKLRGGRGPPPYLSQETLNKLDDLEKEENCLKRRLLHIQMEKQEVLKRGEKEDYKTLMRKLNSDEDEKSEIDVEAGSRTEVRKGTTKSSTPLKEVWNRTRKQISLP
jgi:hypothetical protein